MNDRHTEIRYWIGETDKRAAITLRLQSWVEYFNDSFLLAYYTLFVNRDTDRVSVVLYLHSTRITPQRHTSLRSVNEGASETPIYIHRRVVLQQHSECTLGRLFGHVMTPYFVIPGESSPGLTVSALLGGMRPPFLRN